MPADRFGRLGGSSFATAKALEDTGHPVQVAAFKEMQLVFAHVKNAYVRAAPMLDVEK